MVDGTHVHIHIYVRGMCSTDELNFIGAFQRSQIEVYRESINFQGEGRFQ